MFQHKITLPDGTELGSSVIRSVQLTEQVNDETDLCPGAACAACAEIELWAPENGLTIAQGTEITLARIDAESGAQTPVGVFLAEKPVKASANVIRVTAYDRMTLLDKDLSPWLREHQGDFPMSLTALIQAVCAQCGVTLADGTLDALPNGSYQIAVFYADDLTGRQLIQWAAQAACRFARMTPDGKLDFSWYAERVSPGIGPGDGAEWTALDLSGQLLATVSGEIWTFNQPQAGYLSGTLSYEDYETAPIDKVQIKQTDNDVGVIYPPDDTGTNALVIQGNLLLTTQTADALRPVAQAIYEQMRGVVYTPLQVSIPLAADAPAPGEIITVTDAYGHHMLAYIMQRTISGQRVTLESTGNARRDGTSAVNSQKWQNLQGKVLEIQTSVDGLKVTASDLSGGLASLELTVDGLRTEVSGKLDGEDAQTLIDQSLGALTLSATAGNQSSTLTLKAGSVQLSSATISFNGMVTFDDLAGSGRTVINGDNIKTGTISASLIKTGTISAASGNTTWNLDAGTIITGVSNSTRVEINFNGIRWYSSNYLTGVLYSEYGKTYLGSNSAYTFLGWFSSGYPSIGANKQSYDDNFGGLYYDHGSRLIHCVASKFEIPGRIECASLAVNGREI